MSAFLMPADAISQIVYEFLKTGRSTRTNKCVWFKREDKYIEFDPTKAETFQEVFNILHNENLRSLDSRYGEKTISEHEGREIPAYIPPSSTYKFKFERPEQVITVCDSYHYQACESGDYYETLAHTIVDNVREAAIRSLVKQAYCRNGGEAQDCWGYASPDYVQKPERKAANA